MEAQFKQIIQQCHPQMYSFACYSLRSKEDAEDVLQEVFIRLWQHWQGIDQDKLSAWLMRSTRNAVVDRIRSRKSAREDLQVALEEAELEQPPAREAERFDAALQRAIGELPEPFRSVIILRDIQGMSYLEVGHILDLSPSQVKVYLHRARRRLREVASLRSLAQEAGILAEPRDEHQEHQEHHHET